MSQSSKKHPEERLSFLVHRVNAGLTRVSKPMFKQHGLDPVTSRILVLVLNREQTLVGDVIEFLGLPQSTVSHQIKRLENAGLLRRARDADDNRAYRLSLTTKGRRTAEFCDQRSLKLNQALVRQLNGRNGHAIFEQLHELADLLEAIDPDSLEKR